MCTSFVRIVVVLSLVRSAIGASALPPNAVLTGLALVLTMVVMAPTAARIGHDAVDPYARGRLTPSQALGRAIGPLRRSCCGRREAPDIALFERIAQTPRPPGRRVADDRLVPAFVVGELRTPSPSVLRSICPSSRSTWPSRRC